jgi:hypothetical protein
MGIKLRKNIMNKMKNIKEVNMVLLNLTELSEN